MIEQYDVFRADSTTQKAALALFHHHNPAVPCSTMISWLRRRESIRQSVAAGRSQAAATHSTHWSQKQKTGKFEEQENHLFSEFLAMRLEGKQVTVMWLEARMVQLVRASKAPGGDTFVGSAGWVQKFFVRYNLVIRRTTNVKEKTVQERLPDVVNFYRYLQKVCTDGVHVCDVYGRF